ncbi:MAG: threonine ammonia-lyase [Planctomycetota bacterium]|jgi:threonine dehydratase
MISFAEVQRARINIAPYVRRTILEKNTTLSNQLGTNIYLKLELFQRTGSFKPRGAFSQILQLTPGQRQHGVVGVSGGNFAQGMALAAHELNTRAIVCMPTSTPRNYIEATQGYGAQVDLSPEFPQIFERADQLKREGWNLLHPFDNPFQMAGAGTIGLEILEDLPDVTDVFISIGGGGLFTGIAVAIQALKPEVRIWGVETEGSDTMGQALRAGKVVQIVPKSLAKTLGSPYVAEDALALMQKNPERYLLVSDKEAFDAGVFLLERAKLNTELAASCTLAAARRLKGKFTGKDHVVLLICGGNNSLENWIHYREILA